MGDDARLEATRKAYSYLAGKRRHVCGPAWVRMGLLRTHDGGFASSVPLLPLALALPLVPWPRTINVNHSPWSYASLFRAFSPSPCCPYPKAFYLGIKVSALDRLFHSQPHSLSILTCPLFAYWVRVRTPLLLLFQVSPAWPPPRI